MVGGGGYSARPFPSVKQSAMPHALKERIAFGNFGFSYSSVCVCETQVAMQNVFLLLLPWVVVQKARKTT